jgi:hypothetical protein
VLGIKGDEKVMRARQLPSLLNVSQHVLDQASHSAMHQVSIVDSARHAGSSFVRSATQYPNLGGMKG